MRTVSGTGLFAGLVFHPLVPELLPGSYIVRDFTRGIQGERPSDVAFDIGRYNERRRNMYTSELFSSNDPWCDTSKGAVRDIHIGVDIGGAVGTPLHAVADGVIHSCGYNSEALDYGHVVVVEYQLGGVHVWALHGHLSKESIVDQAGDRIRQAGDRIRAGDVVGYIGDVDENGGWPPQ